MKHRHIATSILWAIALLALSVCFARDAARAEDVLRVAKAVPYPFSYAPLDVGIATGIFEKHGLKIEASAFNGAARLQQALASDSIDIGVGGGTDMGFVAKGAPVLAVAANTTTPIPLVLLVPPDSPIRKVEDL
jgi:ABC-type nitrate/sulfonate/bicarbonate transport system substrate-binding protein